MKDYRKGIVAAEPGGIRGVGQRASKSSPPRPQITKSSRPSSQDMAEVDSLPRLLFKPDGGFQSSIGSSPSDWSGR